MKKVIEKRTILLAVVILTIATTAILFGKLLNTVETEVNHNEALKVFKEALTIVREDYVEDVQPNDLMDDAIEGMVGSLDPHSAFMTPEQYKKIQKDTKGILITKLLNTVEAEVNHNEELKAFKEVFAFLEKNHVEDVHPKDLVYGAIKGMVGSLDPHSAFMTPEQYNEIQLDTKGEFGGIGIQIGINKDMFTVISVIEETPAFMVGIKPGDTLIRINNKVAKDMSLEDVVSEMRGAPSTKVKIAVLREGWKETKDFTINRELIKIKSVKSNMLEDGIGYIKINQFQEQTASDLSTILSKLMQENMNSLILDLRDNPGGLLYSAVKVTSQFIPPGRLVVYTKDKRGEKREFQSRENNPYVTIPMIVIVNEGSASAAEIVAGALKDWHRAIIIGIRTFGKGSVQSVVPLNDGSALRLTSARYYTPKGISIQATGISPDIVVKPKIHKGQQVRPITRESDLKGHLTNGGTKKQTDVYKEMVPMTIDEKEDVQLQKAIDLLRNKMSRVATSQTLKKYIV